MTQYHIPSAHETGAAKKGEVVPNYHPLSRAEIISLLNEAKKKQGDKQAVASIQIRLTQGIVGMQSPVPLDGPVAEAMNRMEHLYVKNYRKGADPKLVAELERLMQLPAQSAG